MLRIHALTMETLPISLTVTRHGDLLALVPGQRSSHELTWQARLGTDLGTRLLELAASPIATLSPDLEFGREFARIVLRALALAPADARHVDPAPGQLELVRASAPSQLAGLKEVSRGMAWRMVMAAAREALARPGVARDPYLRRHGVDPEVGRLCFHLAERPGDDGHPFAFLSTQVRARG